MVSDNLRSPNAIPPRTSSTGHNGINHTASKPVLRPVPEGDWISQRLSTHAPQLGSSINPAIQSGSAPDPSKYNQNEMSFTGKSSWSPEKEKILFGPYDYLEAHPGKDIRKLLIAAFNEWLEVPKESLEVITKVGMDLFWRDTLTCPTEDDYVEMVGNKTGGLFRLAVKLMQAESKSSKDCVPLVNLIGIIFQIRDDYQNLSSPEYSHNKGLCEDLTEGKFSFPIIHSIRAKPDNLVLLNILKQKTDDEQVKKYAVAYMEQTGSFEYSRKVLSTLTERAKKLIDELDEQDGDGEKKGKGVLKILDKIAV
ncbi:geranylgeranyl pyrophosphate synthase protein [Rutstroemia sp. NJR-2017a BBW]|nr:geranylgeranyl pyrophosphate synthase protein [Rutstroemia sp. NJR-2017a BBW]